MNLKVIPLKDRKNYVELSKALDNSTYPKQVVIQSFFFNSLFINNH